MRRITTLLLTTAVLIGIGQMAMAQDEEKPQRKINPNIVKLFNGENLDGWKCFAYAEEGKEPTPVEKIWSVKNGILVCKGEPLGYLYTEKKYTNFRLNVVWRWAPGAEPGNSGILLRIAGDAVSFLPKCAECQLKHESAGDIYGFYGFKVNGPADRLGKIEHEKLGTIYALPKTKMAENKPGEWNRAQIVVIRGTITVIINGEEVNKATDCDVAPGHIGLQSEGGEIQFRAVRLVPIGGKKK